MSGKNRNYDLGVEKSLEPDEAVGRKVLQEALPRSEICGEDEAQEAAASWRILGSIRIAKYGRQEGSLALWIIFRLMPHSVVRTSLSVGMQASVL